MLFRRAMGAFRTVFVVAVLAVGCGGRTSGISGSTSGGEGSSGAPSGSGAVTGSIVATAGASSGMATVDEDAGCTEIAASSYDQSCKSDTDCVTVNVGNACAECVFACAENVGAINAGAMGQYTADLAKTPAGVALCNCPSEGIVVPCCRSGQCHADNECLSLDGSTAADAGTIEEDASAGPAPPPSCAPGGPGMTNCGAAQESCCTSLEVTGGTYYRNYGYVSPLDVPYAVADPATVSSFRLDKYLVTVGRFRQFVNAWNNGAGYTPAAGSGKHTYLNGGNGLNATGGGYEPGWMTTDDSNISPTTANLTSCSPYSTWTNTAVMQENLPINCVNWWEAYAFCIWDGGFLPSEAEWEYAAAGGNQQREYPWGSTAPGTANQYAIYGNYSETGALGPPPVVTCYYPSGTPCTGVTNIAPVGTATLGVGLWGQLDMAGDAWEWTLDWYAASYVDPCTDCADVADVGAASGRVFRGGNFNTGALDLLPPIRSASTPAFRLPDIGFRCSRSP
jgi:sulfatase modifying factor 1